MLTDPKKFTDVIYEVRDRAAWIIINRPKVYNAFRGQTLEELIQAFHLAANDRNVSSIVLTGAGEKAFCTGGDQSAHEGQYDGRGVVGLPIDELQGLIRDVPKPVIARVNGFAIGGGNVLATLCDLTIAADTAQSDPETAQELAGALEELARLSRLVDGLLMLARAEKGTAVKPLTGRRVARTPPAPARTRPGPRRRPRA